MENKIEVVYTKGKMSKRLFAYFIDLSLLILMSFVFLSLSNMVVQSTPMFKEREAELTEIKNDSKLYVDNVYILTYVNDSEEFESFTQKKEFISSALDEFYNNPEYFKSIVEIQADYNKRKADAVNESNIHVFVKNSEDVLIENEQVSPEDLYNFYYTEIDEHALSYLVNNSRYFWLQSHAFIAMVIQFVIISTIMFTVTYLVLPLTCFKRGRQTLGMKMARIGLIEVTAVNQPAGKYVGRFFFMLFVMYYLNFFAFLLPSIVSVTMMFVSKTAQSLVNYVFNDYIVDVTDQKIYMDEMERYVQTAKLSEMSIENNDVVLK